MQNCRFKPPGGTPEWTEEPRASGKEVYEPLGRVRRSAGPRLVRERLGATVRAMATSPDQIRALLQEISGNLVNIIREREHSEPIDPAIPPLIVQVEQLQIAVSQVLDLVAPRE